MATNKGAGVQRILGKLRSSVDNGNFYEAHQMYRTLFFRYMNQKKYAELLDMLYEGAVLFLDHNQQGSGADLCNLLVEVLTKSKAQPSEFMNKLARLFSMLKSDSPDRPGFLSEALKWSVTGTPQHRPGHPRLHQLVANTLWKEHNYTESRYHYLHSCDGEGCGTMLVEYHTRRGYQREVDLFIAQAVLQYLCLQNKATATVVFFTYTEQHPGIQKGPPFLLPLLNFIWLLLLSLDTGKLTVFTVLCEQYKPSIDRDPCYKDYLDRIATIFFNVPAKRRSGGRGLLGSLLSSLVDGLDGSESDSEAVPHPIQEEELD